LREAQGLSVKGLAYAMRIGLMEVIILWFELWSIYYTVMLVEMWVKSEGWNNSI